MGLDYQHSSSERAYQRKTLKTFLQEYGALHSRAVIHCRDGRETGEALKDLLPILRRCLPRKYSVYVHHFTGSLEDVATWQSAFEDVFFGIPGKFMHTDLRLANAFLKVPLDRLLLESDAPHVLRSPWDLSRLTHQVSQLLNMPPSMVAELGRCNACQFYGLPL